MMPQRGLLVFISIVVLFLSTSVAPSDEFEISKKANDVRVTYENRPLVRLVISSSSDSKESLKRVYTHIMDPSDASGKRTLTRKPVPPKPHQAGVFLGWRNTTVQNIGAANTWSLPDGTRQVYVKTLRRETSKKAAYLTIQVDWKSGNTKLLTEHRTIVVHQPPSDKSTLFDQLSTLKATEGTVKLKGDTEHGGYHVRLHENVQKQSVEYMYPPARELQDDRVPDWFAVRFKIENRPFVLQLMSNPSHPKGKGISAYRKQGRFGMYVPDTIQKGKQSTHHIRIYARSSNLPDHKKEMTKRFEAYRRQLESD